MIDLSPLPLSAPGLAQESFTDLLPDEDFVPSHAELPYFDRIDLRTGASGAGDADPAFESPFALAESYGDPLEQEKPQELPAAAAFRGFQPSPFRAVPMDDDWRRPAAPRLAAAPPEAPEAPAWLRLTGAIGAAVMLAGLATVFAPISGDLEPGPATEASPAPASVEMEPVLVATNATR